MRPPRPRFAIALSGRIGAFLASPVALGLLDCSGVSTASRSATFDLFAALRSVV
jgi:hypothetical protein